VLAVQILRGQAAAADQARTRLENTRRLWTASLVAAANPASSYAAVTVPGGARWVELLASAGVPVPALTAGEPGFDLAGYRLVVGAIPAQADALARDGKAVVLLDMRGVRLQAAAIRWKDLRLPLADASVHRLDAAQDERPWLQSEDGETVAAWRRVGNGIVLRIAFDLAAWLYTLRQGDPARVGQDSDHNGTVQPIDLLPELAPELLERPFADEMIDDLLATLEAGLACPLPRSAGLPAGRPTVVLTSDQDYADDEFVLHMADVLEKNSFRATFMLTHRGLGAPPDLNVGAGKPATLARDTVTELLAAGHGLGVHPSLRTVDDLGRVTEAIAELTASRPLVARNHWARWPGYLEVPAAEVRAGIAMDLNFLRVCSGAGPCAGFLGGAARPVRFVDPAGIALPILQQPTAVDDASLRTQSPAEAKIAAAVLGDRIAQLLPRATTVQAPLVINAHPIYFPVASDWLAPLLAAKVQVISAEQWLDFLARRRLGRIASPSCAAPPVLRLEPGVVLR
jgi:hypothetical protein